MNAITNFRPRLPIVVQNEEPRVLDTDLAERLGMSCPRDIRKDLIGANRAEFEARGILRETSANLGKRGRPAKVFYLNEQQALLICMFSRTEKVAAPGVRFNLVEATAGSWRTTGICLRRR